MLTDKKLLNTVGINLDQKTITNTCQVEDSGISPCLDDISPVANDQTDINHDINITLDDSSLNITVGNLNIATDTGSNGNNLSHIKNVSQNENNEDTSIPKKLSNSKKVKQYRSTSIALTKSHSLCCKISIVVAICCTTGFSLLPIVFYYVSQIGNNTPTVPEYSHERNTSKAKVYICYCSYMMHMHA